MIRVVSDVFKGSRRLIVKEHFHDVLASRLYLNMLIVFIRLSIFNIPNIISQSSGIATEHSVILLNYFNVGTGDIRLDSPLTVLSRMHSKHLLVPTVINYLIILCRLIAIVPLFLKQLHIFYLLFDDVVGLYLRQVNALVSLRGSINNIQRNISLMRIVFIQRQWLLIIVLVLSVTIL
jgi:hypothetical protein